MKQPPLFDDLAPPLDAQHALNRAARASGFRLAQEGTQAFEVLRAIRAHGPVSRQSLVRLTRYPINSICGAIDQLAKAGQIEAVGHEAHDWPHRPSTRRTLWRATR